MVDGCHWSDGLVELQMWSRLSVLAFNADNHSLVLHCGQRAVEFADSDKCLAKRQPKKPDRCENNLTSLSALSNWELSFSANLANLASVTGMLKVFLFVSITFLRDSLLSFPIYLSIVVNFSSRVIPFYHDYHSA